MSREFYSQTGSWAYRSGFLGGVRSFPHLGKANDVLNDAGLTLGENTKAIVQEIKEGTPEEFEVAIRGLFDLAREEVVMATDFYSPFYNRDGVKKSLLDAAGRVNSFRVILDSHVDVPVLRGVQGCPWLFENGIEVAKSETPIPHWMMIDRNHFRFEKPHPPNSPGKSNLIIKFASSDEKLIPLINGTVAFLATLWAQAVPVTRPISRDSQNGS